MKVPSGNDNGVLANVSSWLADGLRSLTPLYRQVLIRVRPFAHGVGKQGFGSLRSCDDLTDEPAREVIPCAPMRKSPKVFQSFGECPNQVTVGPNTKELIPSRSSDSS